MIPPPGQKKPRKPRKKILSTGELTDTAHQKLISLQPVSGSSLVNLPSLPISLALPTVPLEAPTLSISAPLPSILESALQTPLSSIPSLLPRFPSVVSRGRPPRPAAPHLTNILQPSTIYCKAATPPATTYSNTTAPTWSLGGSRPAPGPDKDAVGTTFSPVVQIKMSHPSQVRPTIRWPLE